MNLKQYEQFTKDLTALCLADERIIGLVALGSMAQQDYQPDQWSDHDFFVVTQAGQEQAIKDDLSWLPNADRVVFQHQEPSYGMRFLFDDGHLAELAVFPLAELKIAKANRYRVLVDKGDVNAILATLAQETTDWAIKQQANYEEALAHFLSNVWVGYGRYQRGEKLSGHEFVKNFALVNLAKLIVQFVPAEQKSLLDNLNPLRRFEQCYPKIGSELDEALALDVPNCCIRLLEIGERELAAHIPNFPQKAFETVRRYVET